MDREYRFSEALRLTLEDEGLADALRVDMKAAAKRIAKGANRREEMQKLFASTEFRCLTNIFKRCGLI